MKSLILSLVLVTTSLSAYAETILTCKTTNAGGSLIKQIVVDRTDRVLSVKAESYAGEGLNDVKIIKNISTPVSSKIKLETNMGMQVSLVMYKKRAVMLYEANKGDEDDSQGATVEFLSCK